MKIYIENDDGIVYEAFKIDEKTYTIRTENRTYKLFLSESNRVKNPSTLTDKQKKKMTKAIFSNKVILDQLKDARKNRDKDFSYYSGDEIDFDKLVDEIYND